jgi:hypothetical protein
LVKRSLYTVGPVMRSSLPGAEVPSVTQGTNPPLDLLAPTEFDQLDPLLSRSSPARSPGVWSPTAYEATGARSTRAYLTRHLPPTGFLTLLTVSFSRSPLALFHASAAHGVHPSGLFPLTEIPSPFSDGYPHDVNAREEAETSNQHPAFRALLPARIRHLGSGVSHEPRPLPSWAFCLLGISPLLQGASYETHPLLSLPYPSKELPSTATIAAHHYHLR